MSTTSMNKSLVAIKLAGIKNINISLLFLKQESALIIHNKVADIWKRLSVKNIETLLDTHLYIYLHNLCYSKIVI